MRGTILFLLIFSAFRLAGQTLPPIPERSVKIDCENKRTDEVLQDIAVQGKFEFAWDARLFDPAKPVTLHTGTITVRRAIYLLFGNTITFKVKGNYLVLVAAPPPVAASAPAKKREFALNGYTTDLATGKALAHVSVYDSISLSAALSDDYGHYTLTLAGETKPVRIKISRENYLDTFIVVTPSSNLSYDIALRQIPPPPVKKEEPVIIPDTTAAVKDSTPVSFTRRKVESFRFIDSLIGYEQIMQARNLKESLRRSGQASLVPFISTNGAMSGTVRNKFSLNLVGGYTGGTDILEIGAGFNIDRGDVRWVQLAGGFNLTGGNMKGVQAAGGANINLGTLRGVQISGGSNFLFDTLMGIQLAGGCNLTRGEVYGLQIAGGLNVSSRDLDGIQVSGGTNIVFGTVNKAQISSGLNYARKVKGFQLTAGANICLDTLIGGQISSGLNFARSVRGIQFGIVNVTGKLNGRQFGILNFADTCSGTTIGLLSFVVKGIHEFEISSSEKGFINLSFRTGVPKFYNILSFGFDPSFPSLSNWTFGYGIGHRFLLYPKFNLALDLTGHHLNAGNFSEYTSEWVQLAFNAEWRPVKHFAIAAGPVFHYYISGAAEDELAGFHQKPLYSGTQSTGFRDIAWVGASFALRFF